MRIISGYLKGRKLLRPSDKLTRPLKDSVKESIFNILEHSNLLNINFKNLNVLDLFSGVGSFGLECISRGSLSVTFFENYTKVIKILKLNVESMNIQKKMKVKQIFKIFLNLMFRLKNLMVKVNLKKLNLNLN